MRYFEIRAPRADFTGKIGPISFADGVARVQFDDTRDEHGAVLSDEHGISPGRSMVMFARRRPGYSVTELDENGRELAEVSKRPSPAATRAAWEAYAAHVGVPAEEIKAAKNKTEVIDLVDLYTQEEDQ